MAIVINHLTRMNGGHCCVAGLNGGGQHVRPVLDQGRLSRELLVDNGGPFAVGIVVDLGSTRLRPAPPEIEDQVFDPDEVVRLRWADADKLWRHMSDHAAGSLKEIFGDALVRDGRTAAMAPGTGDASLGLYRPRERPRLDGVNGGLRIRIDDPDLGRLSLPLTDLRLYDLHSDSVDERRVELLQDRLRRHYPVLSVGVSRLWLRPGDTEEKHWLQVNNVHLPDNPLWPN